MDELLQNLDEIARTPLLLVASDFDGTIAPLVTDPAVADLDHVGAAVMDEFHNFNDPERGVV